MGLWWVLRPVNIAVTSLLPIPLNAIFGMVPMEGIISKYFSEIVVLLVGSDLISLVWEKTHLDKRLAIKVFAAWEHRCASRYASGWWLQRCCPSFCQRRRCYDSVAGGCK